ncbi:hypothetical protein AC578_9646 [Pseudocercospora eumusae]|uniref:Uncharacterized protein n=1 Tax=Pseudocercospora eumusae TaxID=321146 RepID=A0A139H182_9PEZI|nr:hypothetical protein AC578_9646 [Pseudocercospora eumusae]
MARASLSGIPSTVVHSHPNNSDASSVYLDGNTEPLRREWTPDVQQPQLPQRDFSPRPRRKSAVRGSLKLCDDSLGQQNPLQRSIGESQQPLELSNISLGRQITSHSSDTLPNTLHFGAELTRAPCDPIPQTGVLVPKQKRRSPGILHKLKRSFRCPLQHSSSSTEESTPPRLRVISNERCRPRSIGWPSRLDLASHPTESAYSSLPLQDIPRVSSDIASWLSGLPDFTSNDALGRQSGTMLKGATAASLPGIRSKQNEPVENVEHEEDGATDFFYF